MKKQLFLVFIFFSTMCFAQNNAHLPYYEIPTYNEEYTPQSVASRMVDALGFRYYWASFELTEEDLAYKISEESRSCQETVIHIYDLTNMMLRLTKTEFKQQKEKSEMSFNEMRSQTLLNIQALSKTVEESKDLAEFDIKKDGKTTIFFYNSINGPIADAIWHTGQLAVFRRASGNPINAKIDHFSGKIRE